MDYEKLGGELLLSLRGKHAQTAWSRRLVYKSNVAYAWEAGRRWPSAAETLSAAARVHIDVRAALERYYRKFPLALRAGPDHPPSWVTRDL